MIVTAETLEIFPRDEFFLQVPSSSGVGSLKVLIPADVTDAYVQGMNDPNVTMWLEGVKSNTQTFETIKEYVQHNLDDPDSALLGFYLNKTLRGTVRLHELNRSERSVTMGIALFDKSVWGLGFGWRLIKIVSNAAFETGLIDQIDAGIDEKNVASQRAFQKAGFRSKGNETYAYNYGNALKFMKRI